ncbi:MAG TPA: hypothetical protein VLM91_09500 [Candidatus Methylomirabilis sp.]|nr:hypothetical protein [Candidatus Methylomirabilis sp.]
MRSTSLKNVRLLLALVLVLAQLPVAGGVSAQTQPPPTPQFDMLGFIQEATLDTANAICTPGNDPATGQPSDRLRGGTISVNGVKMIVPCNTLLQLPAATMTWGDLFDPAQSTPVGSYIGAPATPVPANPVVGGLKTGLALADNPMPFPSFEVRVQGNVVNGQYIVGLIVPITQQGLNASSGLISYIDYTTGAFRVGGIPNDPNCAVITSPLCSGALVQVNDPVGRWGLIHSPDPRFSGDYENTTIHASTGIPACIPRVAPPATDPECPLTNRPLNGDPRYPTDPFLATGAPLKNFTMPAPVLVNGANTVTPDAYKQVPMMIGDQVNYAGTLFKINPLATVTDPITGAIIPDNTSANAYISAHTIEDVLGIFTAPGVPPAYVTIEDFLIGTGGAAVQGILQEASTRMTVVGFTTDPTRLVDIYAQDINPCTGQESLRLLATTDPATQPLVGRFVHRVLGGSFMPPTRNYVMKSRTQAVNPLTGLPVELVAANGIVTGQFLLPNFEYIFPENHRLGDPLIPFNFQDLPFLALGSGPVDGFGTTSPILGQLNPWPGVPAPAPVNCAAFGALPVVNAGPDRAAGTGTLVTLAGTVTWDAGDTAASRAVQWAEVNNAVTLGTTTRVDVGNTSTVTTTFTAPNTPATLTFSLTGTDNFGPGSDAVNITVLQPTDIVQFVAATWATQNGKRGPFGKLNVTATTSDPTAILSLSQVSVDGTITNWGTGSNSPANPTTFDWVENKGAAQPASLTITSTKGGTATVTCSAADARGRVTCP